MSSLQNRRGAIKNIIVGSAAVVAGSASSIASPYHKKENLEDKIENLKGNINHSVCQWTYSFISLEELCKAVKKIGFSAIDLLGPKDWPMVQKYGIYSSMCYTAGKTSLTDGFNEKKFHEPLIKDYLETIPLMKKAGYKDVICFSGSRRGMDDETGLQNCVEGLRKILPVAEKNGITLQME
jgi:hydroxypyruvate isomerase